MGSIYRQKGRGTRWLIKYYRDGRAIVEATGTDDWKKASAVLKQREGAIADGRKVSNRPKRLRFEDAVANVTTDYKINGKRSLSDVQRRIDLHLTPFFGGRRMVEIETANIRAYIAHRQAETKDDDGDTIAGAKNATINRELAILKRAFVLAIKDGTLMARPHIPMLKEDNVRAGFFDAEKYEAVKRHLPTPWQPVITFAYLTGWRVRSEVLPITWAQVDEHAQIVRLDAGTTKNSEGRSFPYGELPELAVVMTAQARERDALRDRGVISPFVFHDDAGQRLPEFYSKVWREACRAAGCPGMIPHDFRRTAVRNLVRARVPEKMAMQLTGHKTRSVFDRYDIVNEADLKAAVQQLANAPKEQRQEQRRAGGRRRKNAT